jgi:dTDP-4-dehydrorhamnose 3,5-epimerase-like enzyme
LPKAVTGGRSGEVASFLGGRARLIALSPQKDERGLLVPFDFDTLPFRPRRSFFVADAPVGTVRGGHAHRSALQLLVCIKGRIEVLMRHGQDEVSALLDATPSGLVIEAGVWSSQKYLEPGSVLLVFASEPYDPTSYLES